MRRMIYALVLVCFCVLPVLGADSFRIAIMQAKKGEAKKFAPLIAYMKTKGVAVELTGTKSYDDAAKQFSAGKVDAMFAGSGVAGSMIIKNVAVPCVRPLKQNDTSTYWAVVLARKGSAKFTGDPAYFKGKRVLACSLASSGEFFYRSVHKGKKPGGQLLKARSHGSAIDALAKGVADCAVVKNRVWDSEKTNKAYADLEVVGKDAGENPDGTLILAKKVDAQTQARISAILLGLKDDTSAEATALKTSLGIKAYIATTQADFEHTLKLLRDAGVDQDFDFTFKD